jgi:hypothetical protein
VRFCRHALVFTSRLSRAWALAACTEGAAPFGRPPQQHIARACEWSAMQPDLAHQLFVCEGSEAQARLPQALVAEAVGAAAALTWRRVLLGAVGDGDGSSGCVMRTAEVELRQVCLRRTRKPGCPLPVVPTPLTAGCGLTWLSTPLARLTHCFAYAVCVLPLASALRACLHWLQALPRQSGTHTCTLVSTRWRTCWVVRPGGHPKWRTSSRL